MTNPPIYILWSDCRKHIRKWSSKPFDGGVKYTTDKPMTEPTKTPEPTEIPEPIEIPEWAKQRACDLANGVSGAFMWQPRHVTKDDRPLCALALHILAHETPPVDSLFAAIRYALPASMPDQHIKAIVRNLKVYCGLHGGIEIGGGK